MKQKEYEKEVRELADLLNKKVVRVGHDAEGPIFVLLSAFEARLVDQACEHAMAEHNDGSAEMWVAGNEAARELAAEVGLTIARAREIRERLAAVEQPDYLPVGWRRDILRRLEAEVRT